MISSKIGHSLDPIILRIYHLFFRGGPVRPNQLTVVGFLFGLLCFICTVNNWLLPAGLALFVSGLFDLLDGAVARHYGRVTPYGGFLDSVLDRYTDLSVAFGIFINFLWHGDRVFAVVTFVAAIGMVVVSYIRARAEAARFKCKNGLLERSERTILLIIGLCFNGAFPDLAGIGILKMIIILLAVLTHVTAVQRILRVRSAAILGSGVRGPGSGSQKEGSGVQGTGSLRGTQESDVQEISSQKIGSSFVKK